jgi:predicted CXXCH cytochrome family protein
MTQQAIRLAVILLSLTATPAAALDLLAPAPRCSLKQSKVVVIGTAPGSHRGTVEWEGNSTSFRVRDGRFTVALDLGPGTHVVRFATEGSRLEAQWKITTEPQVDSYGYHPKVGSRECTSCHDPQSPPARGDNVSALCYECHSSYAGRRHTHGPVGIGLCVTCHDPHGSRRPAFLRFDFDELCSYCHNQPVTEKHRRQAGTDPCMTCHDPHGTNSPYQLRNR